MTKPKTYRNQDRRVLTDDDITALADEVETTTYDTDALKPRPTRTPGDGSAPAEVVPVRLDPALRDASRPAHTKSTRRPAKSSDAPYGASSTWPDGGRPSRRIDLPRCVGPAFRGRFGLGRRATDSAGLSDRDDVHRRVQGDRDLGDVSAIRRHHQVTSGERADDDGCVNHVRGAARPQAWPPARHAPLIELFDAAAF